MPRSGRRLGQLSSKPACNQGKAKLTWMKQTHCDSREQITKVNQNETAGSAIEPGMDQRGFARSGLAGVKDPAWLATFFLKHRRSPSDQELEDHAWSVEFQERNGRLPVLDDWIDRYGELRHRG